MTGGDWYPGKRTMSTMSALIEQYLDWLRMRGSSPRTITARREILGRVNASLSYGIEAASADELGAWIYRDQWSSATRETYYGAVRAFFVWACNPHDPKLDFDPSSLLPRPKVHRGLPRPVTDEQLHHILTHAAEPYRLWALLAAYQGLRCIEIAGLRREDVTEQHLRIVYGKGGRPGLLPTNEAVWKAVRPLPPGPLAWTTHGAPADEKWVSIRTAVYFRRHLDMPGVGLHRLRHWFGTNLMRETGNLRVVQELMRHSSPTTTAIYTLITDGERLAAIQALPKFGPGSC